MEPSLIEQPSDYKEQKRLENVKEYQRKFFKNLKKFKRKQNRR